ncbi:unnamed protein product [Caretta caretta]
MVPALMTRNLAGRFSVGLEEKEAAAQGERGDRILAQGRTHLVAHQIQMNLTAKPKHKTCRVPKKLRETLE